MSNHTEPRYDQPFGDPAFEPQATFDFDDTSDDAFRNMRNMSFDPGFNTMAGASDQSAPFDGNQNLYPVGSAAFTTAGGKPSQPNVHPSALWSDGSSASTELVDKGGAAYSRQQELVQDRSSSVNHRWGQITPPDDKITAPSNKRKDSGRTSTSSSSANTKPKLDNSERARNAANSRHARAKKDREEVKLESQSAASSEAGSDVDNDGKREKYREKNRVAAAKCRQKKKENVETLEDKHRVLLAQNNFMKREERQLRDELSRLRTDALNHISSNQECSCSSLHMYNQQQVRALAHGLGNHAHETSPSQGSVGSATGSMSGYDTSGRRPSHPIMTHADMMQTMPASDTYPQQSNFDFNVGTGPESVEMTATADLDDQEFADYLRNSPHGHAGFS